MRAAQRLAGVGLFRARLTALTAYASAGGARAGGRAAGAEAGACRRGTAISPTRTIPGRSRRAYADGTNGEQSLAERDRLRCGLRPRFATPDSQLPGRTRDAEQRELQGSIGEPGEQQVSGAKHHGPQGTLREIS
jgi:hypothetical protein